MRWKNLSVKTMPDGTNINSPCSAEINYLAESVYGDEILIQTSPVNSANNLYDHSVYKISDPKTGKREICRIRLAWNEYK